MLETARAMEAGRLAIPLGHFTPADCLAPLRCLRAAHPTLRGHGFYATLERFFADEPWGARAIADHRTRVEPRPPVDQARVDAWLTPFVVARWPRPLPAKKDAVELLIMAQFPPTEFVLAVREPVALGRLEKSLDVALRFHDAAVNAQLRQTRVLANRTIPQARGPPRGRGTLITRRRSPPA